MARPPVSGSERQAEPSGELLHGGAAELHHILIVHVITSLFVDAAGDNKTAFVRKGTKAATASLYHPLLHTSICIPK